MRRGHLDEPDEYEQRAIDRHPLTQRLNRELLDSFRRNWQLKEKSRSANDHKRPDMNVSGGRG